MRQDVLNYGDADDAANIDVHPTDDGSFLAAATRPIREGQEACVAPPDLAVLTGPQEAVCGTTKCCIFSRYRPSPLVQPAGVYDPRLATPHETVGSCIDEPLRLRATLAQALNRAPGYRDYFAPAYSFGVVSTTWGLCCHSATQQSRYVLSSLSCSCRCALRKADSLTLGLFLVC